MTFWQKWRTFWDAHCLLAKAWSRRTTLMGYVTVMWAVIELNPDIVGGWVTAPKRGAVLLIVGLINAAIGHYNQSLINKQAPP